jgi:hypothetical protein
MFSGLKKIFLGCVVSFVVCFVFFGFEGNVAYANTCTSQATGSWGTIATWTGCGGVVPQVGDNVVIANTHNVTIVTGSINTVTDITIQSGGTLTQNNTSTQTILGDLTVESGGVLTHGYNTTAHSYELDVSAANVTIDGSINVDGRGFMGGTHGQLDPNGYGPSGGGLKAGGAHFGNGGSFTVYGPYPGGTAYGVIGAIATLGSGGGNAYTNSDDGGDGGGLVIITASGSVTVNGSITAVGSGAQNGDSGGGAGGAVKIVADNVYRNAGTYSISVNGEGTGNLGGGGGGGGIYVGYSSSNQIVSGEVTYSGGNSANGNDGAVGTFLAEQLNSAPEVTTVPVFSSQATSGTGYVTLTMIVDDADGHALKVKTEYSDDGGSTWYNPVLNSVTGSVEDGAVEFDNSEAYQIGTNTGVLTTSANTLTIVWDTQSASNGNGALATVAIEEDVQFRITPHDGTVDGSVGGSISFTVDNTDPAGLADFAVDSQTDTGITFSWTAVTTETNWDHYELWYSTAPGVSIGTVFEWDDVDDADLGTMATTGTTMTGLNTLLNVYYYKIWAFDTFGNTISGIEEWTAASPGVPSLGTLAPTSLVVTIDYNSNPAATTFAIEETLSGNYVQADGTIGGSAVWQDEDTWGPTVLVTGLTPNALYKFGLNARTDSSVETGVDMPSNPSYTLANVPSSLVVTVDSSTQITASWGYNSNAMGTEYYVENVSTGANSGWITATSTSFSGLGCGTANAVKVKARNTDSTETAYTSEITVTTSSCGGGVILSPSRSSSRSRSSSSDEEEEGDEDEDSGDDDEGDEIVDEVPDEVADDREEYDREDESVPEDLDEVVDSPVVEVEDVVNVERRPVYIAPEPFEISLDNERAERQRFLDSFDDYADRVESYNDEVRRYFEVDYDFDGDGISNMDEVEAGLNPASVDSDGDGFSDGAERAYGSNPLDSNSVAERFVGMDGSRDSDGDGISDLVELMIGSNPEDSDDGASDQFFGIQDDDDTPTLTVGTLRNIASSGGSPVFSGISSSKPNGEVTITVKDMDGAVIKTMTVKTDAEGKFVAAPLLALADAGVKEGDDIFAQVDDGKTFMLSIVKEIASPEIEVSGAGIEVLDNVDVDEFDYGVALPDQWYKIIVSDKALLYIKGTKHEGRFVAALKDLSNQPEDMKIFAGTANPKTRIVFFFESMITTSVVITDLDGWFELPLPKGLAVGPHKFTGVEINLKNGTVSAPVRGILTMVRPNKILNDMLAKFAIQ